MIDQDKLKTMTQLALYEKKKGKKDLVINSYDKDDYIRFEGLKTLVFVTIAYIAVVGIICVMKLDYLMENFDVLNYGMITFSFVSGLILVIGLYLLLSYRHKKEEYNRMIPRVRRYQRGLKKMKTFYMIEDKQQRDFEKGEWRNGQ